MTFKIHPVSDENFFTPPLTQKDRAQIVNADIDKFSNEGKMAMKYGYRFSDDAYIRTLAMHGIGGCTIFYFKVSEKGWNSVVKEKEYMDSMEDDYEESEGDSDIEIE